MMNEAVGTRIRDARERQRLTQAAVAKALQISPQAVSKWERGESAPDLGTLVPLSRLLGVSTDWLLGAHDTQMDVFDATVLITGVAGFTARAEKTAIRDLVEWINGMLYRVTEGVLRFGGVPVKYIGDGFLCFFAGSEHRRRGLESARHLGGMVSEEINIGVNSGEIYLGSVGHPDYARPDIMGDHVNLAARTLGWVGGQQSGVGATEFVLAEDGAGVPTGATEKVTVKGKTTPVRMFEILV